MRFVLQATDPSTASVVSDAVLEVDNLEELRALLRPRIGDFNPRFQYDLDHSEFERIKARYAMAFEPANIPVSIRPHLALDSLPYKVHTNRELALMLEGKKPFAVLVAEFGPDGIESYTPDAEAIFDTHVRTGRFIKREAIEVTLGRKTRRILYANPSDVWRIDAYLLLLKTAAMSGWNEGFERMEGSLLGYEDWQNDVFIQTIYRPNVDRQRKGSDSN